MYVCDHSTLVPGRSTLTPRSNLTGNLLHPMRMLFIMRHSVTDANRLGRGSLETCAKVFKLV